ncbi:major facilitator superfamily domain-containing protein [Microdochium trichocladiopsis]|uniref:Major facilitator superfamily domain-containing protein n=1 Tax=Microdochium trichocladiopsis TaxID=1682393 RepID=A0A9P9BYR1_9PEZI|nr:major facilitator superfamily domain-containing protein [Microdochium trichocladiopsis]KAH7038293.1 major facilitator superfamily domain-containing protein [Microdochium trichocladiopsis]
MSTTAFDNAADAASVSHGRAPWFRSVPFQIVVACGVSFTAPGMWDALGGLGAGGAAEPYAVSAANALVYGLFAVFCVAAGAINNRIGLKYGLAIGAVGYPLYGAGLYTNNINANTWFMLFGSALCGISAGFFWAAEAAIIIGYPSPKDRAFYLAIWQTAKAAGPIVGGAINLGLNANRDSAGSVSSATYIVFIVIMCLGLPIALTLSPADRVWRKDGTRVVTRTEDTWAAEFMAVGRLFASRRVLLLLPAFFISYFYNGFLSTFLTSYFTVRSRAFSSFFTNFAGIFSSFIIATLLDNQRIFIKTRARIAFLSIITILVGTWIWATILQKQFYDAPEKPVFDWFQGGFGKSYALVFFWTFGGQAFQQFLYWLVGQYATDLSSLSHHTGILRGVEALGQTVAWAMQSEGNANHFVSIGINFGITLLCVVPTWIILSELEHSHEVKVTEQDIVAARAGEEAGVVGGKESSEAESARQQPASTVQ